MVEYEYLNENTNLNHFVKWYTGLVTELNFTLIIIGMILKNNYTVDRQITDIAAVVMLFEITLYSYYESYKKQILHINDAV